MKTNLKLIMLLLSLVILYAVFTESFFRRIRIRVPNPIRVVRRIVRKTGKGFKTGFRKVGEGIKTGFRKAGEGIKTGVRKTGEGLKKVGEGIKKAGELTGKHLYKGLRETGKAFVTASTVVSDILDRVSLQFMHIYV